MDFRGFPAGIIYTPQQQELLAKDASACVCIHTQGYPANSGYDKIHQRTFGASIVPYRHGDWAPESTPLKRRSLVPS